LWPGNNRELQSVLKQALFRATGTVLIPAFLPDTLDESNTPVAASPDGKKPRLLSVGESVLRA
jgi:two-component system nitrogen regulation response regulator GlnG